MLGVCYYPEHCSESLWKSDAAQMAGLGLQYVRIGEFCWSRIEPEDGRIEFDWLDRAIETLAAEGLKVIFGTPTATPPKWLIDKYADILPTDPKTGTQRGFGSRRHYDFSSENYLREALRITEALLQRYGEHPAIVGWQTDNELGCHDTTLSASPAAKKAFQIWCKKRYGDIGALNKAWGNVFWSMEYNNFEQIELPVLTVTEANPAARLAYQRFSSDQVINFHAKTIEIIRSLAPGRFITHNFIPMDDTDVDNFALAKGLDFVSFDNYPLGRSDLFFNGPEREKIKKYHRTGHPDYSTYFFDQVRGLSEGDFWVMEQQPGPVNWADNNPRPAKGMVRLWTLAAFAHGAKCVCYFRWRQIAFAQEQMHAGLLRNDSSRSAAWDEVEQALTDLEKLNLKSPTHSHAKVAILTNADARWITRIEKQGAAYDFEKVEFSYYSALRQLGVDVDFVSVDSDFSQYTLLVAPCLPIVTAGFIDQVQKSIAQSAHWVFGPRSGAKTQEFSLPGNLPPGLLQSILPMKVLSVETTHIDHSEALIFNGDTYSSWGWREELSASDCEGTAFYSDYAPAIVSHNNVSYIGTLTCDLFLKEYFRQRCAQLKISTLEVHESVRISHRGKYVFAFNYSADVQELSLPSSTEFILGSGKIPAHGVSAWKMK